MLCKHLQLSLVHELRNLCLLANLVVFQNGDSIVNENWWLRCFKVGPRMCINFLRIMKKIYGLKNATCLWMTFKACSHFRSSFVVSMHMVFNGQDVKIYEGECEALSKKNEVKTLK